MSGKSAYSVRVSRIGKQIAGRQDKRRERKGDFSRMTRPLRRKETPELSRVKIRPLIAYDLETTNIAVGTPQPLYLTACGDANFWFSGEVFSLTHLSELLETRFLTVELSGTRFVAWNANKFDAYFIAKALLKSNAYIIRPYLTRSKNLRGMCVVLRQFDGDGVEITDKKGVKRISWEFLDGIAMTGIQKPLSELLKTFAPDYLKLDAPDWEHDQFNPRNVEHVKYAERDSEGLYRAMVKARGIIKDHFRIDLCGTIGNLGIKIFQRFIPKRIECWKPPVPVLRAIRETVMRGGFCYCVKKYDGPVWKYDINQAYAAAMREADLPAGKCVVMSTAPRYASTYICRIRATKPGNLIPFYYRDSDGKSVFGFSDIGDTWVTSIEHKQLIAEGWRIDASDFHAWDTHFRMRDYVDTLEALRSGEGRNPKDAQGEIIKSIGNNSYGKTVEQLDGVELLLAAKCPEGFSPYHLGEESDLDEGLMWYRFAEPMLREYHQPQIGAFITAQVRMVVRRAALMLPDAWLYADTDCVIFKRPVELDIDPKRYGAWKLEAAGERYKLIAKKVYASGDFTVKHAKGMNVNRLSESDFARWYEGVPPRQDQLHRQNFVKVMAGFEMFISHSKVGEIRA